MRCLEGFFRDPTVQRIIDDCRGRRAVQGILVDLDFEWLLAWRAGERIDPQEPPKGFDRMGDRLTWAAFRNDVRTSSGWVPYRSLRESDLTWHPPFWSPEIHRLFARWPVVMRICLYPRESGERGEVPRYEAEGFRIVYEPRPIARLAVGPKDRHRPLLGGISMGVNATDAGTLGGVVKDPATGTYYALTCAHVAATGDCVDQPARKDRKGSVIGKVVSHQLPPAFPSHLRRIAVHQKLYASPVDAALVELYTDPSSPKLEVFKMGAITDLLDITDIEQDEELEMTGRSSDWQKLRRSSVSPFYNVTHKATQTEYCFENALIVREPSGATAVSPGDSGAWICKDIGTSWHWAAMVVGGDRQLGIAVAAHRVRDWWQNAGYQLSVC